MAERPPFQRDQLAFAAHIRDPAAHPAPAGVEDRRMAIYRDLFFNNLSNLLGRTFPVLRKLHDAARWRRMVRQFLVRHRSQTPYFLEIPREFLAFLEHEFIPEVDDFPFLLELAHYEWVELALSIDPNEDDPASFAPEGDFIEGVPQLSVLARILCYRFPVHRISPDFKPAAPGEQPTRLAVYRKSDGDLGFMELNPVAAALLALIAGNDEQRPGRELVLDLGRDMGWADSEALVVHARRAMDELKRAGILLGTRRMNQKPAFFMN